MANLNELFKLENILLTGNLIAEIKNIGASGNLQNQLKDLKKMIEGGKLPDDLKKKVEELQEQIQKVNSSGFDDQVYFGNALKQLSPNGAADVLKGIRAIKRRETEPKEALRKARNFISCICTEGDEVKRAQWLQHILTVCSEETPTGSGKYVFNEALFLQYVDDNDMLEDLNPLNEAYKKGEELLEKGWEEGKKVLDEAKTGIEDATKAVDSGKSSIRSWRKDLNPDRYKTKKP